MTVHLLVSGRVQGVSYRAHTRRKAQQLGLVGWVRNLPDGRVEALATGPREGLLALVAWCHEGPEHARVTDVQAEWSDRDAPFPSFEIRR
jgi:acylphosphatase